jgi:hypothetical protein
MNNEQQLLFAVLGTIGLAIYFAPSIVAINRSHRQRAPIIALNLFLGWTLVGWVISLAMASSASSPAPVVVQTLAASALPPDRVKCPHCAELIMREARVCRFCGRDVQASEQVAGS